MSDKSKNPVPCIIAFEMLRTLGYGLWSKLGCLDYAHVTAEQDIRFTCH